MVTALEYANVEAGYGWDALRIPDPRGQELFDALTAHADDLAKLGPIVLSLRSQCTYWLIPTGTEQEAWPTGCRLLTCGSWVTLPDPCVNLSYARWLHLPDDPARLTGAVWLAAALDTTRRAA